MPHRSSSGVPSRLGRPVIVVRRSGPPSPCPPGPRPSDAVGVGRVCTRTAADGRGRSPREPRCPGQPFAPSVARGGGSRACRVPFGSTRSGRAYWWAGPLAARADGVGNVRPPWEGFGGGGQQEQPVAAVGGADVGC